MEYYKELFNYFVDSLFLTVEDNDKIENTDGNCFIIAVGDDINDTIANYKKNLDLLDDCIFVDVLDELTSYNVDLKQFDELLNKEELTVSEEIYVCYLIEFMNTLIHQHITDKIKELSELLNNF